MVCELPIGPRTTVVEGSSCFAQKWFDAFAAVLVCSSRPLLVVAASINLSDYRVHRWGCAVENVYAASEVDPNLANWRNIVEMPPPNRKR